VFQRNRDLWLDAGLALAGMVAQLPGAPGWMHVAFGFSLAVVCPGYAITAALLPDPSLGRAERAVLTIGLSMAVAIVGAVVFNGIEAGLTTVLWEGLAVGATLAGCLAAAWRRRHAPLSKPSRGLQLRTLDWVELALALAVALSSIWLIRVPLSTSGVVGYSLLTMTPAQAHSQPAVTISLSSGEFSATTYRLTLTDNGAAVQEWPAVTLAPGETWQQTVGLAQLRAGGQVQARLYRLASPGSVYRSVALVLGP
jgi:hypothetical protein